MFVLLFILAQTLPVSSSFNLELEYLEGRGLVDLNEIRPYNLEDISFEVSNLTTSGVELTPYERHIVRKLQPFVKDDFNSYSFLGCHAWYRNEPTNYALATRLVFSDQIVDNLKYSNRYFIQYAKTIEDTIPHPWRKFQFFIEDALFRYRFRSMRLELGRKEMLFGPSRTGGILFSNFPGSYDGLFFRVNSGPLYFTTTFSLLGSDRYIALHRFDLTRGRSSLSFSELILFGGKFEPLYLNPLVPYYVSQWGVNRDDNIMWAVDGKIFFGSLKLYGELMIDDYRYDTIPPAPNKLGYLGGFELYHSRGLIVGFEHVHIDKWVYSQRVKRNTYTKDAKCIGHRLGPDGDLYSLALRYRTSSGINIEVIPSLYRKGEGTIDLPFEEEGGDPNPPFPSGIVETTKELSVGLEYFPSLLLNIKFNLKHQIIENEAHIQGSNTTKDIFSLSAQVGI